MMLTAAAAAALLLSATPAAPRTRSAPASPKPPPPSPEQTVVRPEATPSARPAHRGAGAVSYVTAGGRTYLDAGTEDGLSSGAELALTRNGQAVGRCTVQEVAPHHATCTGAQARAGDTFALGPAAAPPPPPIPPPPTPPEVLARRLAVVERTAQPQVAFQPSAAPAPGIMPRPRAVDVSLSEQAWNVSPGGASNKQSLDVLARGVPLTSWLYLDLDARAEHWSARQNPRFRPNDRTQLYVWQAQLTALPTDALSLSAGRVLPWGVPGATVFDGAMVGWHGVVGQGLRGEVGLFGGTVPQPDTLRVTTERATGGGYWILDRQLEGAVLRTEGRLAAVRSPELGTRGEASVTGRLFLRTLDLSAEVNLGAGGKDHAPGFLDSARLDANCRPGNGFVLGGSFWYSALKWPQTFDPPAFPGRSRQADGFASYDVLPWLRLGAVAGISQDVSADLRRWWIGPEATMPRLGGWATVSVGYLEERGWIQGRSAYAQLAATPWKPIWLLARVAWSHEQTAGPLQDEASLTLGGRAELNQYLALRLTLTGRTALDTAGEDGPRSSGVAGLATLQASF